MINFIEPQKGVLRFEINKANIINQHILIMTDMILLGGTEVDVAALYREGQRTLRNLQKHTQELEKTLKNLGVAVSSKTMELKKQRSDLIEGDKLLNEQKNKILIQQGKIKLQSDILKQQVATIHRQKSILYMLGIIIALVIVLGFTIYKAYTNNKKLNLSLKMKIAELAEAKNQAESADRIKSAFLATMSHELRTPLNSVIGFTGIILQGLAGPINEEQRKQLGIVQTSARHLLSLINDVLDISKIEAGQLEVHKEQFDLKSSIEKVAGIVKPLADKKRLSLNVEIAHNVGMLTSDPRRIEQIMLNLLNNAIKFTDSGSVTLTAEMLPGTLWISVADTGIGIKSEDVEKLFKPFQQIDSGLTRQHEGTGLGLVICRRLSELLGGEIRVYSDWGKGSVFKFILPVKGA